MIQWEIQSDTNVRDGISIVKCRVCDPREKVTWEGICWCMLVSVKIALKDLSIQGCWNLEGS